MSASAGAEPLELDLLAATLHSLVAPQRLAARRLETALEGVRRSHRGLSVGAAGSLRSLRSIIDAHERLAADVARTADRFRSADRVLHALGRAAIGVGGTGSGRATADRPRLDPLPDPADDARWGWRWPSDLGADWSWAADPLRAAADVGLGIRSSAGVGIDVIDGVLALGAHVETKAGAWARAAALGAIGPLGLRAAAEAFVGAEAGGRATMGIGRNGARVDVGGGAFVGAKAEGEIGADLGPVGVTAGADARYGIGFDGEVVGSVTWDEIRFRFDAGAALGLGAGFSGGITLHPRDLFEGVVDLGDDTVRITQDAWTAGTGLVGDGIDAGKELVGGAIGSAAKTLSGWLP